MEPAAVIPPPHPTPPTMASASIPNKGSGDVQQSQHQTSTGSGRGYQLPQRFRAKREKNRQQQQQQQQQFHSTGNSNNNSKKDPSVTAVAAVAAAAAAAAAGMTREEMNLNNLLATARHGFPIPFPVTSTPPGPMGVGAGRGPLNFGGGVGGGGVVMFPAPNGHVITKIGPYKEPLLPSGPPPLLPHHGGLNLSPLAFAHHANVKAAMQAMGMFSPNSRKDMGFKFPPPPVLPETPKPPAYSAVDLHKARMHSRSESASHALGQTNSRSTSTSSSPGGGGGGGNSHDPSLKKLMKDLHRCEVSIARYQTMLNEHCDAGLRFLRQAFITLHIGLNAREKDIARELQITRQTAGMILQRRYTTACVLRQLVERAGELEETQLHELKKQIKQFVVDRKVDEEIGTTSRFIGDPDDLLPHVMSFGKVVNRRHVYTHWEGDPAAAVEKSKHTSSRSSTSVFSSPTSSLPTTPSPTNTNENTTSNSRAMSTTKLNGEGSNGDQKSDDSVFETESPTVEEKNRSCDLDVEEVVVSSDHGGDKHEEGESEGMVSAADAREAEDETFREDERNEADEPPCSSGVSSQSPRVGGKEEEEGPQSTSSSAGTRRAGTHPPLTMEGSLDSQQDSTSSTSSSSTASFNSKTPASGSNSPAVGDSPTKPPASTALPVSTHNNKTRQPFSRKFAAPIVVTHTRRSFPKSLPKNLDPKSTVTLLLSSSPSSSSSATSSEKSQQKHGKHGNKNHKSFNNRRQFPSSSSYHPPSSSITTGGTEGDQEETVMSRDSLPFSSASSSPSITTRLKGREKERELWRKRFNSSSVVSGSSSSSGGSGSGGSGGAGEQGRRGSVSGEEGGGVRVKRSAEEMSAIQSRVRESLKAQGVFLYDPVTGTIPPGSWREETTDSGVGKSEPDSLRSSASAADLKKKTPTQLRRERKKRQRERERRQKELERRSQEEGGGCGEKQREGRLSLLTDKTSASTSRTTSPLSSLGNNTSDTPTESLSPSRSLSPPPPPLSGTARLEEQGNKPGRREDETEEKFPKTSNKSFPAGSQLASSSAEDVETLKLTRMNSDVGAPATARKIGMSTGLPNTDSASIEWEMSRQQRRHEGVNATSSGSPCRNRTYSTGSGFATGVGHSRTASLPSSSSPPSPLSPLSLAQNGSSHNNRTPPSSTHFTPQQRNQCTSPVISTTKSIPPSSSSSSTSSFTTPLSISCSNSTIEPSLHSSSPSPSYPATVTSPEHRKLPATTKQQLNGDVPAVCPGKLLQNGSEDGPLLIINGHEE